MREDRLNILLSFVNLRLANEDYNDIDKKVVTELFVNLVSSFDDEKVNFDDEKEYNQVILAISTLIDLTIGEYNFIKSHNEKIVVDKNKISKTILKKYHLLKEDESNDLTSDTNYYDPVITTLRCSQIYLEHINRPFSKINPDISLIPDLFETIFRKISGFTKMMNLGLYPDAFASWRTLHEAECIIKLLLTGGDEVINSYLKHIRYNNAFRLSKSDIYEQGQLDEIFENIKNEMSMHNLKSKDMKKFIEYGWLYSYPDFEKLNPNNKLNFRDCVETLARLHQYNDIYEGTSEITHSSSAFFYANDIFCKDIALALYYQSFIRISDLFIAYVKEHYQLNNLNKIIEDVSQNTQDCKELLDILIVPVKDYLDFPEDE